jgi:hemerythrin
MHEILGHSGIAALRQALAEIVGHIEDLCQHQHVEEDCTFCSAKRVGECERQAVDHLGEIVFLTFDRFTAEDKFMSGIPVAVAHREVIAAHKTDHADISRRLANLVHEWQSDRPKHSIQQLAREVRIWLLEHIETHDIPLQLLTAAGKSPDSLQR